MISLNRIHKAIKYRIESIAKGKGGAPLFSLETVLFMVSTVYGGAMRVRAGLYEKGIFTTHTLSCRVVSVGNIITGGTGKTPMTIMIARLLRDLGYRVVVISRGYRGNMEGRGGIVSDGKTIIKGPDDAGDEPYLMASILKGIPVVVGRRRYEAGVMAMARFRPDVVVLDDAFQHIRLNRDLNLVLMDLNAPLGNGYILPRGLLREPVSALNRADAVVLTRGEGQYAHSAIKRIADRQSVFRGTHRAVLRWVVMCKNGSHGGQSSLSELKGARVVAFSGLADNAQFHRSLKDLGCIIMEQASFPDHHRYGPKDKIYIEQLVENTGARLLVTTDKDFVKLKHQKKWPVDLVVIGVDMDLGSDTGPFTDFVMDRLGF